MTVAEKTIQTTEESSSVRWLHAVDVVLGEVTKWSYEQGWRTVTRGKQAVEESSQEYTMPVLDIITDKNYMGLCREVKLVLEPIFFDPEREIGRLDFYVWPAYYTATLIYKSSSDNWAVAPDRQFSWPSSWSRESFVSITDVLLKT